MPRAVGMGRAERFIQSRPFLCPGGAGARAVWARGGRVTVRRRTRRFGHAALPPCSVLAPRRTTRRQCRDWLGWHRAEGRAKSARAPPCLAGLLIQTREHHPAEAEPGPPHVVRIRTDTFLCSEKCSGCRVRWRWAERSTSIKAARLLSPGNAGVWATLRGVAASPSAAARGVSDTLHSHRAACSLRGALRGGSSAAGSACIGRKTGQNWTVRRPAFLLPSLPRRNGIGFTQRVWPAPHQVTGRVNRAVINALPFRIASACPFPSLLRGAILESNSQQKEAF